MLCIYFLDSDCRQNSKYRKSCIVYERNVREILVLIRKKMNGIWNVLHFIISTCIEWEKKWKIRMDEQSYKYIYTFIIDEISFWLTMYSQWNIAIRIVFEWNVNIVFVELKFKITFQYTKGASQSRLKRFFFFRCLNELILIEMQINLSYVCQILELRK